MYSIIFFQIIEDIVLEYSYSKFQPSITYITTVEDPLNVVIYCCNESKPASLLDKQVLWKQSTAACPPHFSPPYLYSAKTGRGCQDVCMFVWEANHLTFSGHQNRVKYSFLTNVFFITFSQYQKTFHLSYCASLYHKVDIFIVRNFSIIFDFGFFKYLKSFNFLDQTVLKSVMG